MSLKDKAARIDLSHIGRTPAPALVPGQGAKTSIGKHAEALFRDEKLAEENRGLKQKLVDFDGAKPTRLIDPKEIRRSKYANRIEESFETPEFEALKAEIEAAGGNVQPIKVRPVPAVVGETASPVKYEAVFGHRRWWACYLLELPVLAYVDDVSDTELFIEMDRENRNREDLSAWEQGLSYQRALDAGLFSSIKKMAAAVGADAGHMGKAVALAKLPPEVIEAFGSPLNLQFRWSSDLAAAVAKSSDLVISKALEIAKRESQVPPPQVLAELVAAADGKPIPVKEGEEKIVLGKGSKIEAVLRSDTKGRPIIKFAAPLSEARVRELTDLVNKFLSKS